MLSNVAQAVLNCWEQRMLDCVADGVVADFTADADRDPSIRADVLRRLILGLRPTPRCAATYPLTGAGVRIRGARIEGRLNLDFARSLTGESLVPLQLSRCHLDGGISALEARFSSMSLVDCEFRSDPACRHEKAEIDLSGAHIASTFRLSGAGRREMGQALRLNAAHSRVDANFLIENCDMRSPGGSDWPYCLDLSGCEIGGSLHLGPLLHVSGGMSIKGSRIAGDVHLVGAHFVARKGSHAINGQLAHIGRVMFLWRDASQGQLKRFTAEGCVFLYGATILGGLSIAGAVIEGDPQEWSLVLSNARLGRVLTDDQQLPTYSDRLECAGWIALNSATIDGSCDLSGIKAYAINLCQARVGGDLIFGVQGDRAVRTAKDVWLNGIDVDGDLSVESMRIGLEGDAMLYACDAHVRGNARLKGGPCGPLRAEALVLLDMSVERDLLVEQTTLVGGIRAKDLIVGGNAFFHAIQGASNSVRGISFFGARIQGMLGVRSVRTHLLDCADLVAEADVALSDVRSLGDVSFAGATIHGSLDCGGIWVGGFGRQGGDVETAASQFDQVETKLDLTGAHIDNELRLSRARVNGNLWLRDVVIGGSVHTVAPGSRSNRLDERQLLTAQLHACEISGSLDTSSGEFRSGIEITGSVAAFIADHMSVSDDLRICLNVLRVVSIEKAEIGGEMDLSRLRFIGQLKGAKQARSRSERRLSLRHTRITRALRISHSESGSYDPYARVQRLYVGEQSLYPGWKLYVADFRSERIARAQWVAMLVKDRADDEPGKLLILDGRSAPIHELNQEVHLDIGSPEAALEYLIFFSAHVWDAEEGVGFPIILPEQAIVGERRADAKGAYFLAEAYLLWRGNISKAAYRIGTDGSVEMLPGVTHEPAGSRRVAPDIDYSHDPYRMSAVGETTPPYVHSVWNELPSDRWGAIPRLLQDSLAPSVDVQDVLVDLRSAFCGTLEDDDGKAWFSDHEQGHPPQLLLENFVYSTYARDIRNRAVDWQTTAADRRLRWLDAQFPQTGAVDDAARYELRYSPQPYIHLAIVSRQVGDLGICREVEVRKERIEAMLRVRSERRNSRRLIAALSSAANAFYGASFLYGLSSWRALATILLAVVLGWGGTQIANRNGLLVIDSEAARTAASAQRSQCADEISPFWYAVDTFIPLIDLRQESRCAVRGIEHADNAAVTQPLAKTFASGAQPRDRFSAFKATLTAALKHPMLWQSLKALYAVFGWLVISLAILTFTGTLRRRLEHG